MAVNPATMIFSEGATSKVSVYRVTNVTAADTFQVSADYVNCSSAYFWPTTGAVAAALAPVTANTVLTPAGALSKDDGYLVVYGSSS